jgi:threonine dehydrogenase-like Zn-dependent dehydrogenase
MRAFLVTGPGIGEVSEVAEPELRAGQVLVDVAFVGICGTDAGLFRPEPGRLAQTRSSYPLRLGHEWSGTVSAVGHDVEPSWLGRRVTGDTMLGCGHCDRCRAGRHYLCEDRFEIGVRGNWPGALAEKLPVPVSALRPLPDSVDDRTGALVEPGGNSWTAVRASGAEPGSRILIIGPGTIGLLCAQYALAARSEVHVLGIEPASLALARDLGVKAAWTQSDLPALAWTAVIDATDAPTAPGLAVELAEPGGRVVYIGVSHEPSVVDSRQIVRKDLTVVGVLGASRGLEPTIAAYASGAVDPLPVVGAVIGLDDVAAALDGWRPADATRGPKLLVDPRLGR